MEATHKRSIKNGFAYDRLFPRAQGDVYTVRKNASLEDTVAFIPKVVHKHLHQTKAIARKLKGSSLYDSCSNIWHFVYNHIQYEKDKQGFEQIRSPARAWHDRREGVDCDCYSVFISSILLNLGIPHILRITRYRQPYFQHIYPVVPAPSGEIIIDCVANQFDYEVPYSAKKDFPMDLQFLNGFDDPDSIGDTDDFPEGYTGELGDLGKFRLKVNFKKVLHAVNKFNPATVLLRNGLLASMKLNVGGVANKLRWSYLTPAQATAKGITAQKLAKLVKVRNSLEKIFFGAGGQLKNLKKAILKGKGNKDKAVIAGLGSLDFEDIDRMSVNTPLEQLLGPDIYYSENERTFQGFQGFGELGEPVTLASMGAASGVIMKLVSALKKIGGLFSSKGQGGSDGQSSGDSAGQDDKGDASGGASSGSDSPPSNAPAAAITSDTESPPAPVLTNRVSASSAGAGEDGTSSAGSAAPPVTDDNNSSGTNNLSPAGITTPVIPVSAATGASALTAGSSSLPVKDSFWTKNKSWLKPVAIGAGGLTLLAIGYHFLKPKAHPGGASLSGVPGSRKNHHRKTKHKKAPKKKAVALL
jgi:hypothetical protein